MVAITVDQLRRLAPGGRADILRSIADSSGVIESYGINNPGRLCQFLPQIAHESAGFKTTEEYASGSAYEGRRDLGNTKAGDGKRFKGRGVIQCTGRANYRAFTKWVRERYPGAPDFEQQPEAMEQFPWALLSALWFWTTRNLNALADRGDVVGITKKINGGTNGLADRKAKLAIAKNIWGSAPVATPVADADVRDLQEDLIALGYDVKVDGFLGPKTKEAVKDVQRKAGITVDGKAGPATRDAIQKLLDRRTATGEPPKKENVIDALKTPEGLATGGGILTTIFGAASNPGPLQWAIAAVVIVALGAGVYFLVKRLRRAEA